MININNKKSKYILNLEQIKKSKSQLFNINLISYHKDYINKLNNNLDAEIDYYYKTLDILLNYTDDNNKEKYKLYINYCSIMNIDIIKDDKKINNINKCYNCNNIINNDYNNCYKCGLINNIIEFNNNKDDLKYNDEYLPNKTEYKKIVHLTDIINNINCFNVVDDAIIDLIKKEIKILQLEINNISINNIKYILKRLNITVYNDKIPYIYYKITGIKEDVINNKQLEDIKQLFNNIEKSYYKLYKNKKNMISYDFILYKIFIILDLKKYTKYLKLIKDKNLNDELNKIWFNICNHLNLKYVYH